MISQNARVALVDDDPAEREAVGVQLEDAGFEPILVENLDLTVSSAVDQLRGMAAAAVCDHLLSRRGLANFTGAELVAGLYDHHFPAVLLSGYLQDDQDVSIRRFRDKIPVLLSRKETNSNRLKDGISTCRGEIGGDVSPERIGLRSLIRVVGRTFENDEDNVSVIVPAWSQDRIVRLPTALLGEFAAMLPERGEVLPSLYLIGTVNIGAQTAGDLYFNHFEPGPELRDDDGLA